MKLWKVADQNVKYPATDAEGNVVWKNLLRPHWPGLLWIFLILFLAWSYAHDTDQCRSIIEEPEQYCNDWCEQRGYVRVGSGAGGDGWLVDSASQGEGGIRRGGR